MFCRHEFYVTVDGVDETDTIYIHHISLQCHIVVTLGDCYSNWHKCFPYV